MLLQISCGFWERANGRSLWNYRRFLKNDINGRPASSSGRHYNFPIRWLQGREYTRTPTHISGQTAVMCHFSIALTLLKLFPGGPELLSFICLITYLIFVVKFFFLLSLLHLLCKLAHAQDFAQINKVMPRAVGSWCSLSLKWQRQTKATGKYPQHLRPVRKSLRGYQFASLKRRDVDIIYLELAGT
jgi:hypothetical protein